LQSNILLYCVVLLLVLKIITILVSINIPQNIFFADITKSTLESLVNQTRQSSGLQPLSENEKLDQAAKLKAENMVQNQYFDHTSPSGVTPWFWFTQAGYNYKYAGENLAIGFYDSEEVYNAWLNSPSHKANILNPNYKEVGTAVLSGFGSGNATIVVQEFGSPKIQSAPVSPTNENNSLNISNQKISVEKPIANNVSGQKTSITEKTNTNAAVATPQEKVLSQTTQSQSSIEIAKTGTSNAYFKIMNFIVYGNGQLLQNIIYGVSAVVIGIMLIMIFFNTSFHLKKELVFRSVLIVILLSLATLVNKELIVLLIPHQTII
jgi:uncharacterized protein YkwD